MSRAGRGMDTALTALFLLGFYLHADLVLSDGVKVLVQLDAEGQETVLDEVMNVEVSNLIPLN